MHATFFLVYGRQNKGGVVDLENAAKNLLEPMGYEVLELNIGGDNKNRQVSLRIDRLDEKLVSIEDVSTVAKVFGLELDRLDPFENAYKLYVESPGSKRPLKSKRHFERFINLKAKVKTSHKSFKAKIVSVDDDGVEFDFGKEIKKYSYSEIKANLAEWPSEPR